jgi:hypothetical protein
MGEREITTSISQTTGPLVTWRTVLGALEVRIESIYRSHHHHNVTRWRDAHKKAPLPLAHPPAASCRSGWRNRPHRPQRA